MKREELGREVEEWEGKQEGIGDWLLAIGYWPEKKSREELPD